MWKIKVPEGLNIVLQFHEISLEYAANCNYDYVGVAFGGDNGINQLQSQTFCGYYFADIKD